MEEVGERGEVVGVCESDGHGGIARFLDFCICCGLGRTHVLSRLMTGHAADFVIEILAALGVSGGDCGQVFSEAAEVFNEGLDFFIVAFRAMKEAGHLGALLPILRTADKEPEGVCIKPGADAFEAGAWLGAEALLP